MADVDIFGNPIPDHLGNIQQPNDDWGMPGAAPPPAPTPAPAPSPTLANPFQSSAPAPTDAAQSQMIDRDKASWEQRLREEASRAGVGYDASDLQGIINFSSYAGNAGKDPAEAIARMIQNYQQRASNTPNQDDPRVATSQPAPSSGSGSQGQSSPASWSPTPTNLPPTQFSDPYTKMLEEISQQQIQSLTGQNQQMQQLMDFINKQFTAASNTNGYSPEELAILNTQALEPIEQMRNASRRREMERTGARGFLPSSGLHTEGERGIDTEYDRMRTAANRDLAVNNINERQRRLKEALQLAQLGVTFPQQQRGQAIDVAQMLYQLPRNAMMDANTIINGSSPQSAINPYVQLMQQQQQQQQIQQQIQQQNQQQMMAAIGQAIAGLFD